MSERVRALCLGGGGARGFGHLGAVKAARECGIKFDMVVGTSAGALVGALYAAGVETDKMYEFAENLDFGRLHNGIAVAPNDPYKIGKIVTELAGVRTIESLPVKFAAVAVDITRPRQVVLDSGDLCLAVSASCAVPMLYRPVISGERHLVDGGLMNNIPADVCKMLGATEVITVDVNPSRGGGSRGTGLVDMIKAACSITVANASAEGLRHSDKIIAVDTSEFSSMSKTGWETMTERGYKAAKEVFRNLE